MIRILAVLALVPPAAAAWADTLCVQSAGDGHRSLPTGPGRSYAISGEMHHGGPVEAWEWEEGCHKVRHAGAGWRGWAHGRWLTAPR